MNKIDGKPVPNRISLKLCGYVLLTFLGYLVIGLPLAVLPVFITRSLGYNAIIAGLVISLQYFVTFFMRGYSGNMMDKKGPKPAVLISMFSFVLSGIFLFLAYECRAVPHLSLSMIVVARLVTGCGEGMVGVSPINWAMLALGDQHLGTAISFNGIASYGGMSLGAPLGVFLSNVIGIKGLGIFIVIIGITGFILAKNKKACKDKSSGKRQSFMKVLKTVSPFGMCLALGGLGFGTISTFITLYYSYMNWSNGALCLTVFGLAFILTRLVFPNTIRNVGGMRVGIVSLLVELVGFVIIALSPLKWLVLIGAAVAGAGFSLVFPAFGVEAVKLAPPSNKGSALAGYGLFIDISMGITGPLVGLVAEHLGMGKIFYFSSFIVLSGLLLSLYLSKALKDKISAA